MENVQTSNNGLVLSEDTESLKSANLGSFFTKNYKNNDLNIELTTYIDKKQNVCFKDKQIAALLGYKDTDYAIRTHVDEDYKKRYLGETPGYSKVGKPGYFISELGLYQIIFWSKLESAKKFTKWVTSIVLPSIRKYGYYKLYDNPNNDMIKIETETELHHKVVDNIKRFYPDALLIAQFPENQDTAEKRIDSFRKGY